MYRAPFLLSLKPCALDSMLPLLAAAGLQPGEAAGMLPPRVLPSSRSA